MAKLFEKTEHHTATTEGDPIFLPDEIEEANDRKITLGIVFATAGGTAKFQYCEAPKQDILNNADNVIKRDWDLGAVAIDSIDGIDFPITALWCWSDSGTDIYFNIKAVD